MIHYKFNQMPRSYYNKKAERKLYNFELQCVSIAKTIAHPHRRQTISDYRFCFCLTIPQREVVLKNTIEIREQRNTKKEEGEIEV